MPREYRAFLFTNGGRQSTIVEIEDLDVTAELLADDAYRAARAGNMARVESLTRRVRRLSVAMTR